MMCASTFTESNLVSSDSSNQTFPSSVRLLSSGSHSFTIHNFGKVSIPPSLIQPQHSSRHKPPSIQPQKSFFHQNTDSSIDAKIDPIDTKIDTKIGSVDTKETLDNDDLSSCEIDLDSNQSGCSCCHQDKTDTIDTMDNLYKKTLSSTLPSESWKESDNVYPIFTSLSDRLSRYGIEINEPSLGKNGSNVAKSGLEVSNTSGHLNPGYINTSTDSLRKLRKEKKDSQISGTPVVQLTTDSAICLSREVSTDSSSSNASSSTCSNPSSSTCSNPNSPTIKSSRKKVASFRTPTVGTPTLRTSISYDSNVSIGRKSRPKLPPLSVCEEMNRKGFKNWSRGIKSDRKVLGQINSAPIVPSMSNVTIPNVTMATKVSSPKKNHQNWIKNHEGEWIKSDGENIRNLSYKKRESVAVNVSKSGGDMRRRGSVMTTIFGEVGCRRFSQDLRRIPFSDGDEEDQDGISYRTGSPDSGQRSPTPIKVFQVESEETAKVIFFQVFIPFLVAGFGNVGAGLILDKVQHWPVFRSTTELFLLVASFLGFKGNLEMTLAARLATQANTGQLDEPSVQLKVAIGNIALIQSQAVVVGFLAALIAIAVNYFKEFSFHLDSSLLIVATALVTASITGLFLTILMVLVTIASRKIGVNPDNVSTLLAAFLGDISAVILLSASAKLFYDYKHLTALAPCVISCFLPLLVIFLVIARKNPFTHDVVGIGWFPIIIAMIISSIGGLIFDFSVEMFETIAIFQPIINGVGSNLVAVQASRISTYLHQRCNLGTLPLDDGIKYSLCSNPLKAFFGSNANVRTARLLVLMCLPGHIIYIVTIRLIAGNDGNVYITLPFIGIYLLVAILQVLILLYMAHLIVPFLWSKSVDPDNAAIPGIMACGDLLGTAFLTIAYFLLTALRDPNVVNGLKNKLLVTTISPTQSGIFP